LRKALIALYESVNSQVELTDCRPIDLVRSFEKGWRRDVCFARSI